MCSRSCRFERENTPSPDDKCLFSIMLFEIILSAISGISWLDNNEYYGSREGYTVGEVPSSIRQAATKIDELENRNSLFYRTEVKPHKTSNDPSL